MPIGPKPPRLSSTPRASVPRSAGRRRRRGWRTAGFARWSWVHVLGYRRAIPTFVRRRPRYWFSPPRTKQRFLKENCGLLLVMGILGIVMLSRRPSPIAPDRRSVVVSTSLPGDCIGGTCRINGLRIFTLGITVCGSGGCEGLFPRSPLCDTMLSPGRKMVGQIGASGVNPIASRVRPTYPQSAREISFPHHITRGGFTRWPSFISTWCPMPPAKP